MGRDPPQNGGCGNTCERTARTASFGPKVRADDAVLFSIVRNDLRDNDTISRYFDRMARQRLVHTLIDGALRITLDSLQRRPCVTGARLVGGGLAAFA